MTLSLAESEALFERMLDGAMSDEDIATVLIEMAERGETAEELAGAVRAMRARMKCITAPAGAIDVCGTGGDGQHSLNVSTAVALVVAACDVPVATHGNRAASRSIGSPPNCICGETSSKHWNRTATRTCRPQSSSRAT